MLFIQALLVGFGITLGIEIALGLCYALKVVTRSNKK